MSTNRRDFVRAGAAAAAGSLLLPRALGATHPPRMLATPTEIFEGELALEALNAARDAGAQYADARVGRYRRQALNTRERQITGVSDNESYGIGVRTLVDGSWGFASTATMTKEAVVACARTAVRLARAARSTQRRAVELAPVAPVKGTWITPIVKDPIDVPIEEKVALLFATNEAALKVPKIRFCTSGLQLLREVKTLATTEGTLITQTFVRSEASFSATAADGVNVETYQPVRFQPSLRFEAKPWSSSRVRDAGPGGAISSYARLTPFKVTLGICEVWIRASRPSTPSARARTDS